MKPVAWTDGQFCLSFAESDVCPIPLYTAPRELSDDEIMKEWHWKYADTYEDVLIDFAKAILKKASER